MNIEERKEIIEKAFKKTIGLELSESELDQLAEGSSIKFKDLLKNRSFSELGSALIRVDALVAAEDLNNASEFANEVEKGKICITIGNRKICISIISNAPTESIDFSVDILEN